MSYHLYDYTLSPHLHNQIEVAYVIRGTCTISIDHLVYQVKRGDFIIIFPYQLHSFYQPVESEIIVHVFEPDFSSELIPKLGSSLPKEYIICNMPQDCVDAFMKAEHYYQQQANLRIIKSYVGVYMSFLLEKLELVSVKGTDYHSVLQELLLYIDSHFTEYLSLELLAEKFHITRFYISRLFSQKLMTSFSDYVNQLRIDYAVELLCHSDMAICDIAVNSGFDGERHFYRVFKKHTGLTPMQKRKQGDTRSAGYIDKT